ncbi:hypothetical protein CDAR_260191 [Caerostris darwini]|uniref:Uncharacterized protein n=1 Tax=Caerostris darwini TaxID=1538125 RepID=A0AAV4SU46_9ARAC|nr:hypothetical protein CDAR_260191 [Caerostris darwini]
MVFDVRTQQTLLLPLPNVSKCERIDSAEDIRTSALALKFQKQASHLLFTAEIATHSETSIKRDLRASLNLHLNRTNISVLSKNDFFGNLCFDDLLKYSVFRFELSLMHSGGGKNKQAQASGGEARLHSAAKNSHLYQNSLPIAKKLIFIVDTIARAIRANTVFKSR